MITTVYIITRILPTRRRLEAAGVQPNPYLLQQAKIAAVFELLFEVVGVAFLFFGS